MSIPTASPAYNGKTFYTAHIVSQTPSNTLELVSMIRAYECLDLRASIVVSWITVAIAIYVFKLLLPKICSAEISSHKALRLPQSPLYAAAKSKSPF